MSRCPSYLKVAFTVFLVPLTVGCPSKGGSKSPGPSVLPWDYPGYNIRPAIEDSPIKISSFVGSATPELKSIPFIDPSKEDLISEIMNHTYMSHPWMGARFKTVLEGMPGPALRLASCVKLFVLDARQIAAGETDSLVYIGGAYLAQTAEEQKLVSGSTPSVNSRPDLTYKWGDLRSTQLSWRVEYAEDATSKMIKALIPVLTHEMLHACDEKALTADVSVISDTLEIPSADIARSYFMHYLSPSVEYANATNEHTWQEFSDQHLTSIASDSYGYFSQKEHVAQLGEHFLTRLLLGYDYYEVYFDARRPVDSSFDAEVKWGVKNKICQPHVQEQARIFLHKIGLFEDLNLDNDLGCSAELLPSGLSVTDSIKKLEGVP